MTNLPKHHFRFETRRSPVLSTKGIVATSQPLASMAGLRILSEGGNAADAAVAAAATLAVVEPTSTGIGGDCFALYWDAKTERVTALNGSGRAAAAASIDELRGLGYTRMPQFSGHSVSIPGTVAGWSDLLERHGEMTLADVLKPAIRLAEEGYPVTEWIGQGWAGQTAKLLRSPRWASSDLDNGPEQPSGRELLIDGRAPQAGQVMRIPTLGGTLRAIAADDSVRAFLESAATPLAERLDMVDRVARPSVSVNGLGLLHVLVTSRDVDALPEIERGFLRVADRERRMDRVHVTTATPLEAAETEELRQRLAQPGRRLHLTTTTDPALLGGFVVRRGDNVLDLSVRARLQSLGRALR